MLRRPFIYKAAKERLGVLRYPRERMKELQFEKLKRLLRHAYGTVPYYRELFDKQGIKPEDIEAPEDINKIPITSKSDLVRLDRERITSSAISRNKLSEIKTSGTTGEPFSFYVDSRYWQVVAQDLIRSMLLHGMELRDRVMKIGGEVTKVPLNPLRRLVLGTASVSSTVPPGELLAHFRSYSPTILRGFVSNIYAFASWCEANAVELRANLKFILCSGEMVHAYMREKVEKIFGAKVIDRYATAELGVVSDECPHGGYHVFEDSVLPEVVMADGKNYFVGTNLDNYATPFIRYWTGDICQPWPEGDGECPLGLTTMKLKGFVGRDNDFILTPGGGMIAPIDLIFIARSVYPFVTQFRFVQEETENLRFEAVVKGELPREALGQLMGEFGKISGGLRLEVHEVESIPLDNSGKARVIVREM